MIVQNAKAGKLPSLGQPELFSLAHNIVNLPHLRFTGLTPQTARKKSTHVFFIFGQRYLENGKNLVPITVRMHHANGDPIILQNLMSTFDDFSKRTYDV